MIIRVNWIKAIFFISAHFFLAAASGQRAGASAASDQMDGTGGWGESKTVTVSV